MIDREELNKRRKELDKQWNMLPIYILLIYVVGGPLAFIGLGICFYFFGK